MANHAARKYYRKKKRYAGKSSVNQMVSTRHPVPKRTITKLKYTETLLINPPAGGGGFTHVFRANGMFDPDATGTGHQPMGFDQWMLFYDHFTVTGSTIKVNFLNRNATDAYTAGIGLRDSVTTHNNINRFREEAQTNYDYIGVATGGHNTKNVYNRFSAKNFFGRSHVIDNEELRGSASADPTEQALYHILVGPSDSASDEGVLDVNVEIVYTVIFTEPKALVQS